MATYLEGSVKIFLHVRQSYPHSDVEIVDQSDSRDYLADELAPNERIVEVNVEFPVNFFKPAEYQTTIAAAFPAPAGTVTGSAGVVTGSAGVDRHVSFPEDADEVVSVDDRPIKWYNR